jgi:hypothetical protein
MKKKMRIVMAVLLMLSATIAYAGEIDILINNLAEKGIITYGEAQQLMTEGKETARKDLANAQVVTLPQWIQNISLKGDLRLRLQNDWAASAANTRTRERLRLRLGFDTRVVENLKAGFGLATGSEKLLSGTVSDGTVASGKVTGQTATGGSIIDAEPTSTNHTFSNGFAKAMLMVDYAFLEYTPVSWLKVTGGKMKSGTPSWQASDLKWDTDINPDGIAVNLSKDFGNVNVFLNGAWLIFNELNSATLNNPDAYVGQPGVNVKIGDKYNVKAAVAFEDLNVNGKNTGYYGTPAFDYICMNPSVELSAKELVGPFSMAIFSDMISNSDSKPTSDKNGSSYGLRFGNEKVQEFGNWQIVYMARRIETNAWLNTLGDSDAFGGANNSSGYEAILAYGLTKSATLNIDYYSMDKIVGATATTPKSLIQFDVVYKF